MDRREIEEQIEALRPNAPKFADKSTLRRTLLAQEQQKMKRARYMPTLAGLAAVFVMVVTVFSLLQTNDVIFEGSAFEIQSPWARDVTPEEVVYLESAEISRSLVAAGQQFTVNLDWNPSVYQLETSPTVDLQFRDANDVVVGASTFGSLWTGDASDMSEGQLTLPTIGSMTTYAPSHLEAGQYNVMVFLVGANGEQIEAYDLGELEVTTATDSLAVLATNPPAGEAISDAVEVTLAYDVVTLESADLVVKLTAPTESGGRGVGEVTATLPIGSGEITLTVPLERGELGDVETVGLWLAINDPSTGRPTLIDFPEDYRWTVQQAEQIDKADLIVGGRILEVIATDPPAGSVVSDVVTVTLGYQVEESAELDVKLFVWDGAGRGVGRATTMLPVGSGEVTVTVPLQRNEVGNAETVGLWLTLHLPDPMTGQPVIIYPDGFEWPLE